MLRSFHIVLFLNAFVCFQSVQAQHEVSRLFYQLNTSHGLSDNYIRSMVVDKNGFLWVGTGEGLNMFNGKTVSRYFVKDYPALRYNYISQLVCDDQNRIWALTALGHVTMIDEQRRFHHVGLYDDSFLIPTLRILQTKKQGILLYTSNGHFRFIPAHSRSYTTADSLGSKQFERIPIQKFDDRKTTNTPVFKPLTANSYVTYDGNELLLLNYSTNSLTHQIPLFDHSLVGTWDSVTALVYDKSAASLHTINLLDGHWDFPFENLEDQHGIALTGTVTNSLQLGAGKWLLATLTNGLYVFDSLSKQLYNYRHNAADPGTIVNNAPFELAMDSHGWIFAGCTPNGVSYYNQLAVVGQKTIFEDAGSSYDGYISGITTIDSVTWYLSTAEHLIEWNRTSDRVSFVPFAANEKTSGVNSSGITCVGADSLKRLWIATAASGLYVFNPVTGKGSRIGNLYDRHQARVDLHINHSMQGNDGCMWLSCRNGWLRVGTSTLKPANTNALVRALEGVHCVRSYLAKDGSTWVATVGRGVFHYYAASGRLQQFSKENGFPSNNTYAVNEDKIGNTYIATEEGLFIFLKDGKTRRVTIEDGLLNTRVEALICDSAGRMWLGNDVGIAAYDIKNNSLRVFDERYGLSIQGFKVNSFAQGLNGIQIWGTERGLQFFYPEELYKQRALVTAMINQVESRNFNAAITRNADLHFGAADNNITFRFSGIEYNPNLRTFYRYRLEGYDRDWTSVTDQSFARYNTLPPGNYRFRVQASNDGALWKEAENAVKLAIAHPWQRHPLVIAGALVFAAALFWLGFSSYRRRRLLERQEVETESVIHYFASQINSRSNTEDILWDVAGNCISRLHFTDCVIYLLDRERNVLVQKAAYGPKSPRDNTISQPIEIPLGRGIVGTVANTGAPVMIGNTSVDPRYIIDDEKRLSELAVPLIIDGKVIGVIDSEHPRKNFFTANHLRILSTIAVLCANQIQRAEAEKARQQADMEVLRNKQQAAEYRLQSLRLQMNPHFLFNALNSIQQMILANEELVATKYLSRFSKLLRAILVHSDKELISLQEEIEMLRLYIDLESVRFKDSFTCEFECGKSVDTEELRIPTLLVQPFVENAIWHGLMHKDGNKHLRLAFEETSDFIKCTIEDNGVGRKHAAALAVATGRDNHKSKGILVSSERLKKLGGESHHSGNILISDLYDEIGTATGTRVEIFIPF